MHLGGRRCALPPNPPPAFFFFKFASSHCHIASKNIRKKKHKKKKTRMTAAPSPQKMTEHKTQMQKHPMHLSKNTTERNKKCIFFIIFFSSQAATDLGDTGSPELQMRRRRDRVSPKLDLVPSSLADSENFTASVWKHQMEWYQPVKTKNHNTTPNKTDQTQQQPTKNNKKTTHQTSKTTNQPHNNQPAGTVSHHHLASETARGWDLPNAHQYIFSST